MKSKFFGCEARKILPALVVGIMIFSLAMASCGGSSKLVGRWETVKEEDEEDARHFWFEFTATRIKWYIPGMGFFEESESPAYKYKVEGNKILYNVFGGWLSYDFKFLDNDTLVLEGDIYKRVKK